MATLKLHYDGWLTLPAGLRDRLDLKTGDHLQAELVDGAIVLRPTHGKRVPTEPEPAAEMPVAATAAADTVAAPVKRPRGRPRKVQADPSQAELLPGLEVQLAPPQRKPGRPRKVRTDAAALDSAPEARSPGDAAVMWKLRPKATLPEASPEPVPNSLPLRRRQPGWTGGSEPEERRPFRNVEVRKLGPGRRHNRSRQTTGS